MVTYNSRTNVAVVRQYGPFIASGEADKYNSRIAIPKVFMYVY